MRARFAIVLVTVLACVAAASCGDGGTGVGTAPGQSPPCPAALPAASDKCPALQVCNYRGDPDAASDDRVAVCAFAGANWEIHAPGDAGTFTDAEIPEISVDSGSETSDASSDGGTEAGDAPLEAETVDAASDAVDAVPEAASDTASPDTAASDTASSDTASSDTGLDVALPDLGL